MWVTASTKLLNSTTIFNLESNEKTNVSSALVQHIKIISEGTSDTENGCWKLNCAITGLDIYILTQ